MIYALMGGEFEGEYKPGDGIFAKLSACAFQAVNSTVVLHCEGCGKSWRYRWVAVTQERIVLALDLTGLPIPQQVS